MKKEIFIVTSLIAVIVCLLITRTVISNGISTSGEVLGQIKEKTNALKMENAIIGEELYAMVSLTNLSEKAEKLGFVNSKDTVSLTKSLPLAIKQ